MSSTAVLTASAATSPQAARMSRWTAAKLAKEEVFATLSDDSPEGVAWCAAIAAEVARRANVAVQS